MNNLYLTVQLDKRFKPCKRNLVVAKSREQARYLAYLGKKDLSTKRNWISMEWSMPNFSVKLIKKNIQREKKGVVSCETRFFWAWNLADKRRKTY